MVSRKTSRVAFTFVVATAVVITCVTLYSLVAGFSRFETLFLLIGSLVVIWALIFSFFEVRRIADHSPSISETDKRSDPDASRLVNVAPATGHPYPHHEDQHESAGLDQGQLTARMPDTFPHK
jgi:fatty acid desaturase